MKPFRFDDSFRINDLIHRSEADLACEHLLRGRHVAVLGSRGIGKTSLLRLVGAQMKEHDFREVYLDLSQANDARELAGALQDPPENKTAGGRTLFLLDEASEATELAESSLGRALRSRAPHLRVVFASADAIAAKRLAAQDAGASVEMIQLSMLEHDPLRIFLVERFQHLGEDVTPVVDDLIELSGGHPQRSLLLASRLFDALHTGQNVEEAWVDARDQVFEELSGTFQTAWEAHTSEIDRRVLRALASGHEALFAAATLKAFGLSKSSASRARDRLLEQGRLRHGPDGSICLADPLFGAWIKAGRKPLEPSLQQRKASQALRGAPFGDPDAARVDIKELFSDYVPLSFREDDIPDPASRWHGMMRVIVGRKGSGKTLYLRRLQAAAASQSGVYADVVSNATPSTNEIVRISHQYPAGSLIEAWSALWRAAIIRSTACQLLTVPALASSVTEFRDDLRTAYEAVGGHATVPRSIGTELKELIASFSSSRSLERHLNEPHWTDLAHWVGEALKCAPPVSFYIDSLDEEFEHAPHFWLACQKGLFYTVMRLLRDSRMGNRLHVVVGIRDLVFSSVLTSEHATRYRGSPYIQELNWNEQIIHRFLREKLRRLPADQMMNPDGDTGVASWLGQDRIVDDHGFDCDLETYIVQHTRFLPRDVILIGNELCNLILAAKSSNGEISSDEIRAVIDRSARLFGREELAIAANQITADLMPIGAVDAGYSEIYTGGPSSDITSSPYQASVKTLLAETLHPFSSDTLNREDIARLDAEFHSHFGDATDVLSVLWQHGLIGYSLDIGNKVFRESGGIEDPALPRFHDTYVLHPVLEAAIN
jgi:energy-coupling factor transporter ATP-binding protein EcfA2